MSNKKIQFCLLIYLSFISLFSVTMENGRPSEHTKKYPSIASICAQNSLMDNCLYYGIQYESQKFYSNINHLDHYDLIAKFFSISKILKIKDNLNVKDKKNGKTPLMNSIDDRLMVEILLKAGASLDCISNEGWTALSLAAKKGYTKTIEILLSYAKSLQSRKEFINYQTYDKKTALEWACIARKNSKKYGSQAYLYEEDYLHIVQMLVQSGAEFRNSLYLALYYGNYKIAKFLIEKGANLNLSHFKLVQTHQREGYLEMLEFLLECNDIKNQISRYSTLVGAAICGDAAQIQLLISKMEVLNPIEIDESFSYALACMFDPLVVLRFLNPDIKVWPENSILTEIAKYLKLETINYIKVIKILLGHGISQQTKNQALIKAIDEDTVELAEILLENKASIFEAFGNEALDIIKSHGSDKIYNFLVRYFADKENKNKS